MRQLQKWLVGFVLIFSLSFNGLAYGKTVYLRTGLTGGATDTVDVIDGADLSDGDICQVTYGNNFYVYLLDDDSGAAEASPGVISPDTNAGNKRWILKSLSGFSSVSLASEGLTVDGTLTIQDGQIVKITTINAATYDLLTTDYILNVTYTTTGSVTSLTLPTAQVEAGRIVYIKDAGGNSATYPIIVDTQGAETIDGAATITINSNYGGVGIYCDGTNWFIR